MEIHHFDGIYQEIQGFSMAMLVYHEGSTFPMISLSSRLNPQNYPNKTSLSQKYGAKIKGFDYRHLRGFLNKALKQPSFFGVHHKHLVTW